MSFGRKGLAPGATAPGAPGGFGRAQAAAPAEIAEIDDMDARREAFIASERLRRSDEIEEGSLPSPEAMASLHNSARGLARPAQPMGAGPVGAHGLPHAQEEQIRAAARGMMSKERSMPQQSYSGGTGGKKYFFGDPAGRSLGIAYLIWFVIGQTGMHRVYCGQAESAIYQVGLLVVSFVTLFIFPPIGVIGFLAWICWIVGDLFMMPGMLAKFKAQHSYEAGIFE